MRTGWRTLPGCTVSRDGWGRWKRFGRRSRTMCGGLRSGWSRTRRRCVGGGEVRSRRRLEIGMVKGLSDFASHMLLYALPHACLG